MLATAPKLGKNALNEISIIGAQNLSLKSRTASRKLYGGIQIILLHIITVT